VLRISAMTGEGTDALIEKLVRMMDSLDQKPDRENE